MDEHIVISIARQYGSGGRTVGKMLAEKLGISFYDKEIIRMASDESGIDLGLFGKVEGGNKIKPSLFNSFHLQHAMNNCSNLWHSIPFKFRMIFKPFHIQR